MSDARVTAIVLGCIAVAGLVYYVATRLIPDAPPRRRLPDDGTMWWSDAPWAEHPKWKTTPEIKQDQVYGIGQHKVRVHQIRVTGNGYIVSVRDFRTGMLEILTIDHISAERRVWSPLDPLERSMG